MRIVSCALSTDLMDQCRQWCVPTTNAPNPFTGSALKRYICMRRNELLLHILARFSKNWPTMRLLVYIYIYTCTLLNDSCVDFSPCSG